MTYPNAYQIQLTLQDASNNATAKQCTYRNQSRNIFIDKNLENYKQTIVDSLILCMVTFNFFLRRM